jgi:hypothetical protein
MVSKLEGSGNADKVPVGRRKLGPYFSLQYILKSCGAYAEHKLKSENLQGVF